MKKVGLAVLLGLVMAGTAVFADHPGGWGVGGQWGSWRNWKANDSLGSYDKFHNDFGLSLKAPQLPVYWGIYLNLDSYGSGVDHFGLGVTGDYYFIDDPLVKDIYLNWYLGAGGRFAFNGYSGSGWSYSSLFLGARGVVGLSWQLPLSGSSLKAFEVFLDVAPSLGVDMFFGGDYKGDKVHFPSGGWGWDFGLRLWV